MPVLVPLTYQYPFLISGVTPLLPSFGLYVTLYDTTSVPSE
jgi:hypothetical protein